MAAPGFATRAIHAGQEPEPAYGATITPIYQTSTYTQEGIGLHRGYEYSRSGNPTRAALETCLAALEDAQYGLAFASGVAATAAVLFSLLTPGDHVVAGQDLYGGTFRLFDKICTPQQIDFTFVNCQEPDDFAAALRPETRLVWVETPTNPLLHLVDIAAVARHTHAGGATLAVDSTFGTPYFQRPLALGADIVVHSTTKYIAGHSDAIGGAAIMNDRDLYEALKFYQNAAGAVPSPFDSWLTLRGAKTLALRMKQHEANAKAVVAYLEAHPLVETVYYPGLPEHPQYGLARRQMSGFGGMVTFQFRGTRAQIDRFFRSLRVFSFAESLGGIESLACYPVAMTHGSIPDVRRSRGLTSNTIRLSVGIEDVEDLLADLEQALAVAGTDK